MTLPPFLLQEPDATSLAWRLLEMPALWIVVLILAPAALLVAGLAYWRERLPNGARATLVVLRFTSIALLLLVLFRPVQVHSQEKVTEPEVVVVLDDSASMSRKDAYQGDDETRRAMQALAGRPIEETTRLELLQNAVERRLLPALQERGYRARLFRFDEGFNPLASLSSLAGRGHGTHIGDALGQALAVHRGHHVTDIVLVSDGRNNGGAPVLDAGAGARASGVPVHTVVVGDTRPERNLVVELIEVPGSVLEGDEIAVIVRVQARGAQGGESAQVLLEELPARGSRDEPRTVAQESVRLEDGGERVVLVAPPGRAGVSTTERRFRVSVPPLPDERMLDDNRLEVSVHVTPEKIRVLYVDGYPRWEYRQLKDMLLRADERIEAQVYLMSATPGFPQEVSPGLPRLDRVPVERRELLDNYDVVILGDVNPYAVSPDPVQGETFVQSLFEFVERGGGLCLLAGEWDNPKSISGTEFAKLYPVKLDSTGALAFEDDTDTELRPVLEDPSSPHEIVRLHPDLDLNRRLWEDPGGLRGFFWYYPSLGAKPGAQVLLRHPQASLSNREERDPLLVIGYYPAGRTLFLALDETHRWQFRYEHRYHERFWRNAIRWLALGRLKSGDRRYGLEPLRSEYSLDERVTLEARVLDEDYRPSTEERQGAFLEGPDGETTELSLTLVEGRPGLYRTTFDAERPGLYRSWIESGGQRLATTEFEVVLPSRENADPSPDPQTMRDLAALTGARAVTLADLDALLAEFPGDEERREPISSQLEDAWDHWGTLLLALGLLSVEWILRKRFELV
jgi:uncharacterized membrane protein